jgi:hypothetical protein
MNALSDQSAFAPAAGGCDCGCWDYQQLKTENERLRAVLQQIAEGSPTRNWGPIAKAAFDEDRP